jgi:uncharacterized OB-fold protein
MTAQEASAEKRMVPLREGIFRLPSSPDEEPGLIGSRCQNCGDRFFPKRHICLSCGQEGIEETTLGRRGKIWTYTVARQTPPGSLMQAPYVIAVVQLADGPMVQAVLSECDLEAVRVGMEVEMVLEKMGTSAEGNDLMAFKFKPI